MTSKPITTILFDFDGTLADTNGLIIATFEHVLNEHFPGRFKREEILTFLGPSLYDTFSSFAPENAELLIAEYQQWNKAHHDDFVTEFGGVSNALRELKNRGVKMAVVSTKKREMVERGLNLLGITGHFDVVIGLDDVTKPKPDPEPLLLALGRLGRSADEALMEIGRAHV